MTGGAPRAQLKDVGLERLDDGSCLVRVEMVHKLSSKLHQTYVGKALGECSPSGELRCAAEATLLALARAYNAKKSDLTFVDIKTVESFDKLAVIVAVNARHDGKTWRLVGFCEVIKNLRTAAAKAVCNSLNRFLTLAH
jgi:hypothetical protein